MYFQFPLMILIIAPALDGLRREWREAAENAGASAFQYWRHVALPILTPSILGAMILLFGNSFGAQATAFQLTGGDAEHHHPRHQLPDPRRRPPQRRGSAMPRRWAWSSSWRSRSGCTRSSSAAPSGGSGHEPITIPDRRERRPDGPRHGGPRRERRRGIGAPWAWLVFVLGALYFILPLIGTFLHSIRTRPDIFLAYRQVLADPKFAGGLLYSFTVGVITIIVSLLIIVPTAYWVRLKVPRLRPVVEFVTLMPFVIPPVILVFGLIRTYSSRPIQLTATNTGSDVLLVAAYVVLSFPYMYRAVDTGLASMDVRTR